MRTVNLLIKVRRILRIDELKRNMQSVELSVYESSTDIDFLFKEKLFTLLSQINQGNILDYTICRAPRVCIQDRDKC